MSQDTTVKQDEEGSAPLNLPPDPSRRFWIGTTCVVGGAAGAALALPFANSFAPSEKAKAAGAPVEVDISAIAPGGMRTVEWRGKPVWIVRRTPEQLASLSKVNGELADPNSLRPGYTPPYAQTNGAPVSLNCGLVWPFARTWVARPPLSLKPVRSLACQTIGKAAAFVPAMGQLSIWPAAFLKTSLRLTT